MTYAVARLGMELWGCLGTAICGLSYLSLEGGRNAVVQEHDRDSLFVRIAYRERLRLLAGLYGTVRGGVG